MKKLIKFIINLFPYRKNDDWAVRYFAVEYQKEYMEFKRLGINVTPKLALGFLTNVGDKNVK